MTRIVGRADLATIVGRVGLTPLLDELIDRLRLALVDHDPARSETPVRTGFSYREPDLGLIEWMPAMELGRRVAIKTVGYHPSNPGLRDAPSVLATTSLYDTVDGRLLVVCEATALTALRTGAASAIATEVLAPAGAAALGIVGCGAQAISQIHAISRVRPITKIIAFDRAAEVAATLSDRLAGLDMELGTGIEIQIVAEDQLGYLMNTVDVLCTATTVEPGVGPVVPESEHRPWLHINAVGADFPGKVELPPAYLRNALVCPDVAAQCLAEGEAQQLGAGDLGPDLATLARNAAEYRRHRDLLTVFDSTGWALEDMVAAELITDYATALDIGTDVDLQPATDDPYDPYAGLVPTPSKAPLTTTTGVHP